MAARTRSNATFWPRPCLGFDAGLRMHRAGRIGGFRIAALGAAIWAACLPLSPLAQVDDRAPAFLRLMPAVTLADALDEPYGHIQVDRIVDAMMSAADQKCIAERKLSKREFDALARHVLLEVEEVHAAARLGALERTKAEALFASEADAAIVATVSKAVGDPEFRGYWEPLGEFRRMELVRNAAIELQKLVNQILPGNAIVFEAKAAGDRELLELGDDVSEVVERAIAGFEPSVVHALTTFEIASKLAIEGATPPGAIAMLMPASLIDVVEAPFKAHCVGGKP